MNILFNYPPSNNSSTAYIQENEINNPNLFLRYGVFNSLSLNMSDIQRLSEYPEFNYSLSNNSSTAYIRGNEINNPNPFPCYSDVKWISPNEGPVCSNCLPTRRLPAHDAADHRHIKLVIGRMVGMKSAFPEFASPRLLRCFTAVEHVMAGQFFTELKKNVNMQGLSLVTVRLDGEPAGNS